VGEIIDGTREKDENYSSAPERSKKMDSQERPKDLIRSF
jgi:hypothetical protein